MAKAIKKLLTMNHTRRDLDRKPTAGYRDMQIVKKLKKVNKSDKGKEKFHKKEFNRRILPSQERTLTSYEKVLYLN